MKFLSAHPWLGVAAVALGFILNWGLGRFPQTIADSEDSGKPSYRVWILWFLLGLFYIGAYLTRPVYYEAYHAGSLGDNYNYVHAGVNIAHYSNPQHFYFPWVPAQFFKAALRAKFFSLQDPMIMEKAFPFFSLPDRLLAFLGFLLLAGILRLARCSTLESVLGAWLLAVSFGYWFWSLQSNAMGTLLLMILLSLYLTILALQKGTPWLYVLAGLATSLCLYVHISSVYACLGLASAVIGVSFHRVLVQKRPKAWVGPVLFGTTAAVLAMAYYSLASSCYHTTDLRTLFRTVTDYNVSGTFHLDREHIRLIFQDGLSVNLTLLLGLIYSGEKSTWEVVVVVLQLSLMCVWAISLIRLPWKKMMTIEDHLPFWVAAIVFMSFVIGFAMRKTFLQYYAAITPVFVLLVALVAFSRRETGIAWITSLIVCTLYINGLSSTKVFAREHLMDYPIYRRLHGLNALWPHERVTYIANQEDYYFNFFAILKYYGSRGALSNISWMEPVPLESLIALLKAPHSVIALNAALYPQLAGKTHYAGHRIEHLRLQCPEAIELIVFPAND